MKLERCEKGHFFDAEKNSVCPHCAPVQKTEEVIHRASPGQIAYVPHELAGMPATSFMTDEKDKNFISEDPVITETVDKDFKKFCLRDIRYNNLYNLEKKCVTIGRAASNDIALENRHVGKMQAVLIYDGGWYICAMNSLNGTYINGSEIVPLALYKLSDGDIIMLANHQFRFSEKPI